MFSRVSSHLEKTDNRERDPHPLRASELRGPLEPHAGDARHNREGHRRQQVKPCQGNHAVVHLGEGRESAKTLLLILGVWKVVAYRDSQLFTFRDRGVRSIL